MPSDSTLIAAILPSADAFRSSLASTADQLRGLLASMDRGDEAELELETAALGGFAEGRIDVRRFLAVTAVVRPSAGRRLDAGAGTRLLGAR